MKAYSIFDDFTEEAIEILTDAGVKLVVHPYGIPRPNFDEMKIILEEYDCIIIGTSQKITPEMFENINTPKLIATASVGVDHINVPADKQKLVTIINTPKANAQSVAEYTVGAILCYFKKFSEGNSLYREGKSNKALRKKPEDMLGKTLGVIGAGSISEKVMDYADMLGMEVWFWTRNLCRHEELCAKGYAYKNLDYIFTYADVISVNLPNKVETNGIIDKRLIDLMKLNSLFISISRIDVLDVDALINKAINNIDFGVCLDIDVEPKIIEKLKDIPNVIVTPHIAGGTVETRKRMFREIAKKISEGR